MQALRNYLSLIVLAFLAAVVVAGYYTFNHVREEAYHQARLNLERQIKTFWELVQTKGDQFSIRQNRLLIGSYEVNGNYELPDKVKAIFGGTATIFMGDTRVSTNVPREDGSRAVGTKLVGPAYDAVLRQGVPYRGEVAILGKPYLTAYDPILNARGEVIGALYVGIEKGGFLDRYNRLLIIFLTPVVFLAAVTTVLYLMLLSQGKRAEQLQKRNLHFLQALIDTLPTPVFYKDSQGHYLGCNLAFESMFKLSRADVIGKTAYDVVSPELASQYVANDRQLMDAPAGATHQYESKIRTAEGIERDVIFYKARFEDDSSCGIIGTLLDITERKQIENRLRASERQLSDIIEFLPDATWVINSDGCVVAWNRACEELTGVQASQLIGQGDYAYAIPFYGERRKLLIDLVLEGIPLDVNSYSLIDQEQNFITAEAFVPCVHAGKGAYLWGTARRLFDNTGKVVGAIETLRDISERKKMQQVMVQTEKMMTVGGLAAGMAHELNNPIGTIAQHAQNILRRISTRLPANAAAAVETGVSLSDLRAYLERRGIVGMLEAINSSCERAATIIANMLTFSRKSAVQTESVSLAALMEKSIELALCDYDLKKHYDFKNVTVVREYAPDLPLIQVVPMEIEQVLLNLLKNAAHALAAHPPVGGPLITVRLYYDASSVVIELEDNGPGVDEAERSRIFEPFYTTKEVGVGTGLGLSVSYAIIVNRHNGSITVDSPRGKGACFTIRLPRTTPA